MLLEYMMTHPDELVSRERLLDVVWGWDYPVGTRAVDTRIAELRRALDDDPGQPLLHRDHPRAGLPLRRHGGNTTMKHLRWLFTLAPGTLGAGLALYFFLSYR